MPNTPISTIIAAVAKEFGATRDEILSYNNTARVSHARAFAMKLARTETTASYPLIGREFKRHHSTVINAVRRSHSLIDLMPEYYDRVQAVKEALKNQP